MLNFLLTFKSESAIIYMSNRTTVELKLIQHSVSDLIEPVWNRNKLCSTARTARTARATAADL